jgi:hypothetical protein
LNHGLPQGSNRACWSFQGHPQEQG